MQVMPRDQTSTFPSYWPSSMAKITSGAILEKTQRTRRVIRRTTCKMCFSEITKKAALREKNSDVVDLFYYSGVKTEHLQTNKAALKLFNQQLVKVKSQRAALMMLMMLMMLKTTFQLI